MTEQDPTLTRRNALKGLAGAAGASALAGCGTPLSHSGGNQFRYLQALKPISLDPIVIDEPYSAAPANLVFQGLYTWDRELNLVPVLADGEPTVSEDGTTYEVTLQEGPTFHNGDAVTAADVAYSFDPETYEESHSPNVWQVEMIDAIETPDDRTVRFELKYPYPAFEHTLTRAVVPRAVRKGSPETFGSTSAVGSGPYEVETFAPSSYALLQDWDGYWGTTTASIETVQIVPNHAGLSRSMSLLTNQSDVIERVHPKLWETTENWLGANVVSTESYHSHFLGFNCSPGGPTQYPNVREAVDYLLDMDDLVESVVAPAGVRQYAPFPDHLAEEWGLPLEKWREVPHQKDIEKARSLVEEAGVGNWTPIVAVPEDKMRMKIAKAVVKGLRKIGFGKARMKKYHWSHFRQKVTSGDASDYDMYVGSWAGFADPDTFLYPLFHDSMVGKTNGTFYHNPDVRRRLQKARETAKQRDRKQLYAEATTSILEDRAILPAYTLHNSFGVENHVAGFDPHPLADENPGMLSPSGEVSLSTQ